MVLDAKSPSTHNRVVGRRISHPASTKFHDDAISPPAKKLKRFDSLGSTLSRESTLDEENPRLYSPSKPMPKEIRDSEDEIKEEEDVVPQSSQTDLESSLPPVKTDKEAIEEYETMRAQDRMKARKWRRGRSSIYVDAFNLALDTVLEEEGELFDGAEMAVFDIWRNLSYEAQYL